MSLSNQLFSPYSHEHISFWPVAMHRIFFYLEAIQGSVDDLCVGRAENRKIMGRVSKIMSLLFEPNRGPYR
jgi:hypothetical protein